MSANAGNGSQVQFRFDRKKGLSDRFREPFGDDSLKLKLPNRFCNVTEASCSFSTLLERNCPVASLLSLANDVKREKYGGTFLNRQSQMTVK
jgi:hypothetical protein